MNIEFTNELRNHLLEQVDLQAQDERLKKNGKPMLRLQYAVIISAIATIDFLNLQSNPASKSCIPADIALATFRGQPILRKEESAKS